MFLYIERDKMEEKRVLILSVAFATHKLNTLEEAEVCEPGQSTERGPRAARALVAGPARDRGAPLLLTNLTSLP